MILIFSTNQEPTTTEVTRWLTFMKKSFIRVNENEVFEIKVNQKRIFLESQKNSFFLDEVSSVWYRRGGLIFKHCRYVNKAIDLHMDETQHWLQDYVSKTLESKRHLNKQTTNNVNKLIVLDKARESGLDVPKYFLAENTNDVILNETIIKSITQNVVLDDIEKDLDGIMYTNVVEEHENENFFISFFQEKIEKDFEIRSFYLDGKIWSFAIFSQNDEQTKIDFRRYNTKNPNRNVRYNLPIEIEERIHTLMKSLDLNCGSLDFLKNADTYYFLEVNPVGQFAGLSAICNYSLTREIANYL
ncbi:ATP-GRASP peptide maturase of grasp-with-spasm system [Flavobacterium arsenatis]|uniref:ATP-GRASP peptide maturase of grasp-with-spasm system n=1 Tax=Flavobacterium arsenatis TaxID=1484332 RepID=A0ABU1TQE6_9FLAO|nr:grasp-with-spasm system ATP-grasp peptide maturase [Flavobacterium arsenatis]MDR6968206.1 ATP-GRASP peptide maturase of grasp-with-spasm system [Flavobacterium arsenatis]